MQVLNHKGSDLHKYIVLCCLITSSIFPLETVLKFKSLKKPAQLSVISSLEKVCAFVNSTIDTITIYTYIFYFAITCKVIIVNISDMFVSGLLELG